MADVRGPPPSLPPDPFVEAVPVGGEGSQLEPRPDEVGRRAHHHRPQSVTLPIAAGGHGLDVPGRERAPGDTDDSGDDRSMGDRLGAVEGHDPPAAAGVLPVVVGVTVAKGAADQGPDPWARSPVISRSSITRTTVMPTGRPNRPGGTISVATVEPCSGRSR